MVIQRLSYKELVFYVSHTRYFKSAIAVGTLVAVCRFAYTIYMKITDKRRRKLYPKDVVILHRFPPGLRAPSFSPFVLKLETWLRMANIQYQNEYSYRFSSKRLMPWITYNKVDIADSQYCIQYLSKTLNKDLNSHLNERQKAVARAVMKLCEESLRWAMILHRAIYSGDPEESGVSRFIFMIMRRTNLRNTYAQGYGRHTKEEVYEIGKKDLKALDLLIGENKFLFGSQICDTDSTVFGLLAQFVNHDRGPFNQYILSECPNIVRYCNTMKEIYWPDWNEMITERTKAY